MKDADATKPKLSLGESNPALGADELNLCEFPFAAFGSTASSTKTLTFEDQIFDEGNQQLVQRKLIVSASDAFGLPSPVDSDVLLVLMHLTNCQNRFQSSTVQFTRYELVKFLGWDNGGRSYRRLELSLQRLASVTLFYNKAWWQRERRRWSSQTFHILESLDLRGREGSSGPSDDGLSSFTWNKMLFSSFQSNHLKRLDLGSYFRLKIPAARQAYRFLDKRFYRSQRFEMDLRVFACEHVGFSRNYDNAQLKRKLQPALTELESLGFLSPAPSSERFVRRQHGQWQIVLMRQSGTKAAIVNQEAGDSLLLALTERGVRTTIAAALIQKFSRERVAEKIELHDWLVERKDPRICQNPAGYLAAAIREDYKPPKTFVPKAARAKAEQKVVTERTAAVKLENASRERSKSRQTALEYLEQLSAAERRELETAALAAGASDSVEQYRKMGDSHFGQMLLKEIVVTFLQNSGRVKSQAA